MHPVKECDINRPTKDLLCIALGEEFVTFHLKEITGRLIAKYVR